MGQTQRGVSEVAALGTWGQGGWVLGVGPHEVCGLALAFGDLLRTVVVLDPGRRRFHWVVKREHDRGGAVAEVVTVVEAVEPGRAGEAGAGEANCCSSVVLWAFSCCCFFFTSCSADLRSSRVTPWVDRRVSLTLLAWAFLWISCSSSRTGGTNDLRLQILVWGLRGQLERWNTSQSR